VWLSPCHVRAAEQSADTNAVWLAEHYTKYEHRIPMRDGLRLFTRFYVPKDDSEAWPIILTRTPYALKPYGADNYTDASGSFRTLATNHFILVTQDVRGRYGSEGEYMHVRPFNPNKGPKDTDENSDAYDTIDWLVRNVPNNNGNVGMFGISYPGFYTAMGMIDSHPALKAASPQAPISDWFMGDDLHHNGAFFLSQNFGFFYFFAQKVEDPLHEEFKSFNFETPDGYDFFLRMGPLANSDTLLMKGRSPEWTEFLKHSTYDDYWKARNIRPHLKNVHCAVMTVGGWYDAEDLFGPLETYRWTERQNPGITNVLVMGPWAHAATSPEGKIGDVTFGTQAVFDMNVTVLKWYDYVMKGRKNEFATGAPVRIFVMGDNVWRDEKEFPLVGTKSTKYFLHSTRGANSLNGDGMISTTAPKTEKPDTFEYDPASPVPTIGGRLCCGAALPPGARGCPRPIRPRRLQPRGSAPQRLRRGERLKARSPERS
jgi:hypothetical protein